ncbi:hypothetical protein [Pontibacter ramchanderi]|uniref:Uncharacterized protein n=1 Tax=Pontibacter ramchanderi TaxID=1179743 RepID=A0A2N3V3Q0_9BACT|nr:hypothetical protein [Pontibacter ramchanderi]PKV76265.1 hypothetical protein BD749_1215 [Pontibacter ramchanderi]
MQTFFCRHSSSLDIDVDTFNFLWDNDYMAIHYPHTKSSNGYKDTESLNPNDYDTSGKKALNALINISKNGGYIFCVYENKRNYKIGFVAPNTKIELIKGKWGNKNGVGNRVAVLKGLKFKSSLTLNSSEAISLTCAQPRQGTLCIWRSTGARVKNIFHGKISSKILGDLTPDLQEVMCSEFLRVHSDDRLPRLVSLLTPVGRTMKDVDIVGISATGTKIFAQVTYSKEPQFKINKLLKYRNENNVLILFSKTDNPRDEKNIIIYSIEKVFNEFILTEVGRNWIENIK